MNCVDLEVGLYHPSGGSLVIELRYSQPDRDSDVRCRSTTELHIDDAELKQHELDDHYGDQLTKLLFSNPDIKARFVEARTIAREAGIPLRFRLVIGPNAEELHSYHWERLCDPDDNSPLGSNERILFSRYVGTFADEPAGPRPRSELKALVVVANPQDLAEKTGGTLESVDAGELAERARGNLEPIETEVLIDHPITLNGILEKLRDGFDILYLICHGHYVDGQTWLYLEDSDGNLRRVPGQEFVQRLRGLTTRPRLVVLASCQSASAGDAASVGDAGAIAPIGPTLASDAGIGAVIAMQGNVLMETHSTFMDRFFTALAEDGIVDRAMTVARRHISDQPDWWAPVLFMRLRSGRMWYQQGFHGAAGSDIEPWPNLIDNLRDGKCTPIVGPGVMDAVLGSRRDIARRWAYEFSFPLAPQLSDDLPQVAQYLAIKRKSRVAPHQQLRRNLEEHLRTEYESLLGDSGKRMNLSQLMTKIGKALRQKNDSDPHKLLAQLPVSIYITTNLSNTLAEAIAEVDGEGQPKRRPRVEWCKWNDSIETVALDADGKPSMKTIEEIEPDYVPDADNPLVYHLFGHLEEPVSIVLTEDDYFDYLIGSTTNRTLMPENVRSSLTNAGLLFLGYDLDDWNFRVLFRSIIKQGGAARLVRFPQVAVQIDPEESRTLEPDGAREYLEKYFERADAGNMSVYWGNSTLFIKDFYEHWRKSEYD